MRFLTVAELGTLLTHLFDADEMLSDLWVQGEVFDFKQHSSGHWYFKLKDGDSVIGAACWRSSVARISMRPRNGDQVLAHGRMGFYRASGSLQFYADAMQPAGVGLLHAQFEQLKARLEAEGLFDASRKRPLPAYPRRIGVVTSPTGAVIRDIQHVLTRRYPLAELLLAPARVQGDGASDSIVEALYALYDTDVDVIIVARGGGSMEDLWAFNEEIVARAVFASPVPLISGVGHETDVTIIDFVADLRAPTPSAAAEVVSPDIGDMQYALADLRERLDAAQTAQLASLRDVLEHDRRHLQLVSPATRLTRDRQQMTTLLERARRTMRHRLALQRSQLAGVRAQMLALSPQSALDRGYAILETDAGAVVTDPAQLRSGATLRATVRGGTFAVRVPPRTTGK